MSAKHMKVPKKSVLESLSHSFIFSMLKSTIAVMLMVWLLFLIKPSTGNVYVEMDGIGEHVCEARVVEADIKVNPAEYRDDAASNLFEWQHLSINSYRKVRIDLDGAVVTGNIEFDDVDYLELIAPSTNQRSVDFEGIITQNVPSILVYATNDSGLIHSMKCSSDTRYIEDVSEQRSLGQISFGFGCGNDDNENHPSLIISSNDIVANFSGEVKLSVSDFEKAYYVCSDGSQKELTPLESTHHIDLSIAGTLDHISDVDGPDSKKVGSISIEASENRPNHILAEYWSDYDFSFETQSCQSMLAQGSGTAYLSYTPNPNEYTLHDQVVLLENSSLYKKGIPGLGNDYGEYRLFEVSVDSKANTLVASGEVSEAIISGMNLFPDFRNWYFSNVYMAPFTIVSIAFSTLAQMLAVRKGNEK